MQKAHLLILLIIAFFLVNCSTPNKTSGGAVNKQKLNGRAFQKIFIEVATLDIQIRLRLENDLAGTFIAEGYAAVKSLDMIPFSLK